jgi:excisionase family DNA binding protein
MMAAVRNTAPDVIDPATSEELLTTGEAARLLNSSRQHVVNLCNRGDLPFVTTGTHRRVRRDDVETFRSRTARMSRDQRRSLWLAHAIAGRIVADPERARAIATANLERMSASARGGATRWLRDWAALLEGPVEQLVQEYVSPSPRGRELRQTTPFAGLLTDDERAQVLAAWRRSQ